MSQLGAIAEYISIASPVYAEQIVEQAVQRLDQACRFPESGRVVRNSSGRTFASSSNRRTGYRVHPNTIEVIAVVHARRELRALP